MIRVSVFLVLLLSLPAIVPAEQLPVRTYTTADGLPRDYVLRIVAYPLQAGPPSIRRLPFILVTR